MEEGLSFIVAAVRGTGESEMTSEQQLAIRAELARRMGWQTVGGRWLPPETALPLKYGNSGFPIEPPDPFTNAEDKDALVAWLAEQSDDTWIKFQNKLFFVWMGSPNRKQDSSHFVRFVMTAPLETITFCAARALGITGE